MKKTLSILCALSVALPGLGFAQDRDHRDDHDRRDDHRPEQRHAPDRHDGPPHREVIVERGAGPEHNFRRGGRLPPAYRTHQYVVNDWRGHHLKAPPRGYHWVQTGSDYVLVAIATGIIAQVLLSQ